MIDSSEDLAISVNATLREFGQEELPKTLVQSYVGNGAPALIDRAFGINTSQHTLSEGLAFFLKFYRAHALQHTKLYPGIREAVEELAREHSLAILTNKPERISTDLIAALGLAQQFPKVYGGDRFPKKKPDPIGILALMKDAQTEPDRTLMIGDTSVDIETARNAGVRSCGVRWGFKPESFSVAAPDISIDRPDQLVSSIAHLNGIGANHS